MSCLQNSPCPNIWLRIEPLLIDFADYTCLFFPSECFGWGCWFIAKCVLCLPIADSNWTRVNLVFPSSGNKYIFFQNVFEEPEAVMWHLATCHPHFIQTLHLVCILNLMCKMQFLQPSTAHALDVLCKVAALFQQRRDWQVARVCDWNAHLSYVLAVPIFVVVVILGMNRAHVGRKPQAIVRKSDVYSRMCHKAATDISGSDVCWEPLTLF